MVDAVGDGVAGSTEFILLLFDFLSLVVANKLDLRSETSGLGVVSIGTVPY